MVDLTEGASWFVKTGESKTGVFDEEDDQEEVKVSENLQNLADIETAILEARYGTNIGTYEEPIRSINEVAGIIGVSDRVIIRYLKKFLLKVGID